MMEVYKAVSSFKAPSSSSKNGPASAGGGCANALSFSKGDKFEVLEQENKVWWGARALKDNAVGYVPVKYLKFEERKVGKLLPENFKSEREAHLRKLEAMHRMQANLPGGHPFPDVPEPEPDYQNDDGNMLPDVDNGKPQGLIEPKKLPNPCAESKDHQELHRQLLYNSKMGINVLNQKTELQLKMEKRRDSQKRKEQVEIQKSKRTSFELELEKQANKIKEYEHKQSSVNDVAEEDGENQPEFFKIHAKIRSKGSIENLDEIGTSLKDNVQNTSAS
ncbi:uncharacterized protein LOC141902708 [Tubulanus polymorphus]|uniref:uncharacterized protein LOC141902708 n=1 Tax=Tubulanus polymorphus TaxID=672921 RepID=UPI003DA4F08F